MKGIFNCLMLSFLFVSILPEIFLAQIPKTISYQGVLTDNAGNPKADGDYDFTFSFYEAEAGGDAIWSESKTLTVTQGLFSTSLGDVTPFGSEVKFDKPYWLGIKVGTEAEISPRIALTSSGYSFSSINSDTTKNIINGKVVKSLNGLKDNVTLEGDGGTSISKSGNKITISSSSGSGSGIQGIQNTNNTIDITNPNGPTAFVDLKVPLSLSSNTAYVLQAEATGSGFGLSGISDNGIGVVGYSSATSGATYGVAANSNSPDGYAVSGWNLATTGDAVGVIGKTSSPDGIGVRGEGYFGVYGESSNIGVLGSGVFGVLGESFDPEGVGVFAQAFSGALAGYFIGNVDINGTLSKSAGSFKIDHPLDPANKYLYHSFVESPDMKNIYDGVITTDANGKAIVTLPNWFEALNKDFRYQLTVIGQQAQAWIETKIQNNSFTIKTDKPNVEVSWQVTGIRHDAYADKNRIPVEEYKKEDEKGKYVYPEGFGQNREEGIGYRKINAPEIDKSIIEKNKKMNNK